MPETLSKYYVSCAGKLCLSISRKERVFRAGIMTSITYPPDVYEVIGVTRGWPQPYHFVKVEIRR